MKDESINDILYIEIQLKIDKCNAKAKLFGWMFYGTKILLIVFAALITLLTAYKEIEKGEYTTIILWLGSLTTILTSIDTLYQTDAKRNAYKTMLYEFRILRTDFVYQFDLHCKSIPQELRQKCFQELNRIDSMGRDLIGVEKE